MTTCTSKTLLDIIRRGFRDLASSIEDASRSLPSPGSFMSPWANAVHEVFEFDVPKFYINRLLFVQF
jgi:hypothetical protein